MTPRLKARADRVAQQKHRGGKTSPVTDLEDTLIVLAWEAGELTEGQAATALGVCRIGARMRREALLGRGISLAYELKKGRAKGGEA